MKRGFSFVELMVVIGISSILLVMTLSVLLMTYQNHSLSEDRLDVLDNARRAEHEITTLLRQSSVSWTDTAGVTYGITITAGNRIDFYIPTNTAIPPQIQLVTIRPDATDPSQLLKIIGAAAPVVISRNLNAISFQGGCAGGAAFNCATVALNCPVVTISMQHTIAATPRSHGANLTSNTRIQLRNATRTGVTAPS